MKINIFLLIFEMVILGFLFILYTLKIFKMKVT